VSRPDALTLSTALEDYEGSLAVSMRRLYTKLRPRMWRGEVKSLLVASAVHAEGRSTVAGNLAITIARHKRTETLLVDADLQRPALHRMMALSRGKGFSDLLRGEARVEDVVRETPYRNLRLVTCGSELERPAALFEPEALQRVVSGFGRSFDLVLFDSPPLLVGPEAATLAGAVDGSILIVLRSRTRRSEVLAAQRALDVGGGSRPLGLVLNNAALPRRQRAVRESA
jgi:capsular exopolysaccharide synthesis family protein